MKKGKRMLVTAALAPSVFVTPARAAGIADSDLGRGFINLLQDATVFMGVAGVTIGALAAMCFFAARGMADPQDAPMWNKRIKWAIISAVAIPLVSAIINLVASYF